MSENLAKGSAPLTTSVAPTSLVSPGPSQVVVSAGPSCSRFPVSIVIFLNAGGHYHFNPYSNDSVLELFRLFETVDLISASGTITALSGVSRKVAWGIHTTHTFPKTCDEILLCPMAGFVQGTSVGGITENFSLPSDHPFGRRIKGQNLGNWSPCFTFGADSTGSTLAGIVRMTIVVEVMGAAPLHALSFTSEPTPGASEPTTQSRQQSSPGFS